MILFYIIIENIQIKTGATAVGEIIGSPRKRRGVTDQYVEMNYNDYIDNTLSDFIRVDDNNNGYLDEGDNYLSEET